MTSKKDEQKFSIIDLFKGGIPNPAGYPVPKPPAKNTFLLGEKTPKYGAKSKTEKK